MLTFAPLFWTTPAVLTSRTDTQRILAVTLSTAGVTASKGIPFMNGNILSHRDATATGKQHQQKPISIFPTVSEVDSAVHDLLNAVSP